MSSEELAEDESFDAVEPGAGRGRPKSVSGSLSCGQRRDWLDCESHDTIGLIQSLGSG
jgi:hypothetical protein